MRHERGNRRSIAFTYRLIVGCCAAVILAAAGALAVMQNSETVLQMKASDVYSFEFVSQESGTDRDEVYYTDSFFDRSNGAYDHGLARASLALSMTAFKREHVTEFMKDIGYEEIVTYRYDQNGDEDKVALVMGHKSLSSRSIIAIAIRGGKYGDEWGSNGRVGYDGESFGYHYGFHKAAEDAIVQLKEYAAEYDLSLGESKIWITGFSRGAAVANVMGAMLAGNAADGDAVTLESGEISGGDAVTISPENLFGYTFASPSTVSESLVTENSDKTQALYSSGHIAKQRGIYNVINPLDIVTRLPMNVTGISKSTGGSTVRYKWDYVKYGSNVYLPSDTENAQLQVVQLLENALAFATRNEARYVEKTQDQVIIPALKKAMGKGAEVSKRNVGVVLINSLPGVGTFLKNEVNQLDFAAQIYVAGILAGKKSIRLEKEHWPETYWGWMMKVDELK